MAVFSARACRSASLALLLGTALSTCATQSWAAAGDKERDKVGGMGAGLLQSQGLEAEDFAAKVEALFSREGASLKLGAPSVTGDSVTFDGLTLTLSDNGGGPIELSTPLTFEGVEALPDGGYRAATLIIPDVDYRREAGRVTVQNITFNDILLPGGPPTLLDSLQAIGSYSAGPIAIDNKGAQVVSINSFIAHNDYRPEQGSATLQNVGSTAQISGFVAHLDLVDDKRTRDIIERFGINTVNGEFFEEVQWSLGDGNFAVDQFAVFLDNLGGIDMTLDIEGVTPDLLLAVSAMTQQAQDAAASDDSKAAEQVNTQLGLMFLQQISLKRLSVRYDDASLAGKLLDYFADEQNISREELVTSLKLQVPLLAGNLRVPELAAIVGEAVSAFLDDPQSLEVTVAPSRPISGLEIVALAAAPPMLLQSLGLAVTANR